MRVLIAVSLLALAGCVHNQTAEKLEVPSMAVERAKEIVRSHPNGAYTVHIDGDWHRSTTQRVALAWNGPRFFSDEKSSLLCPYEQMSVRVDAKYIGWSTWMDDCPKRGEQMHVRFSNKAEGLHKARELAAALLALKKDYVARMSPETPEQQAAFDAVASEYRVSKPALPEDAVRYKAQAEFAVEQKRFDDAVELYGKALEAAPWWAQGRYNRGLILGELQAYAPAIAELRKYLKLAPEAPNAQAVQTKIYQWESVAR